MILIIHKRSEIRSRLVKLRTRARGSILFSRVHVHFPMSDIKCSNYISVVRNSWRVLHHGQLLYSVREFGSSPMSQKGLLTSTAWRKPCVSMLKTGASAQLRYKASRWVLATSAGNAVALTKATTEASHLSSSPAELREVGTGTVADCLLYRMILL